MGSYFFFASSYIISILISKPSLNKRTEVFRTLCAQKTVSSQRHQRTIHTSRETKTTTEVHYQPTTQSPEEGAQRSFETLSHDHDDNLGKYLLSTIPHYVLINNLILIRSSRKSTTTAEIQYQPTTQSSEKGAKRSFETLESRQ